MNHPAAQSTLLTPLTRDHAFLRREASPAYWALAPHLISQYTDCACALASATMVFNAMRSLDGHHRIGDVVTELRLLEAMNDDHWRTAFRPTDGDGLKLARYAEDLPRALDLFQLTGWSVSMHRMPAADTVAAFALRKALTALQQRADRLIIANFHLATFYGDGVDIGHYSPLAAYDADSDRILVLDVYKPDYEPSWAPLERMMAAMSVHDDKDVPRGYILLSRTDGNAIRP
ncbi:MAG: phytochelatin synthase family protein [Dongiaceae bacterium]